MPWWLTAIQNLALGALGGLGTVYGLSRWLGNMWLEKQKAKYSKELEEFKSELQNEQKRIQATIDRHVFVSRAHFDTEFAAMKEVFKGLSEIFLALNGLRPSFSVSPIGEERKEKIKRLFERLGVLEKAYDDLIGTYAALSPFYPEELYIAVQKCLQVANTEIMMVKTSSETETFNREWWQEAETARKEFGQAYMEVGKIIRSRIAVLSVLPEM